MKRSFYILVALCLLSLAGCREEAKKDDAQIEVQPDIKLASVAKFLQDDGSWYLTEQEYEVFAKTKSITLTAREPYGQIVWVVQNGKASVQKKPWRGIFDKELFELITNEAISKGLLELFTAGLGHTYTSSDQGQNFTFEGRIYESAFDDGNGTILYKDKSTGRKDLVVFDGKKRHILYGYNYLKTAKDRYFPSKIDVYVCEDKSGRLLIAQYTCRLP
ncbi:MAG: hypothetical protein JW806_04555 [Sedimentisphaerales bacterium]|nr:hypothetical protein [Sedimentisphaerales bacterium]